jgi:hypothetical protein
MTEQDTKAYAQLNAKLINYLFETNLTLAQVAEQMFITSKELNKIINKLGLGWVKDHRRKMSKGQTVLTSIMKKLLPSETIVNEFHLGERLKLDVYCPKYKLGAEFHGIQHFQYTERFFDTRDDFLEAQKRDERKIQLCKEQGIVLVVFRYDDKLTEESVYDRILAAIKSSGAEPVVKKKKNSITSNPSYIIAKKNNSEKKKKLYKELKEKRKK